MTTAREESVTFTSQGLELSGVVRVPDAARAGERRPAFIVLHGFGSNKQAGNVLGPCNLLGELGYVTLRFDMRGCGESGGERGHLVCLDQVQNTRDALDVSRSASGRSIPGASPSSAAASAPRSRSMPRGSTSEWPRRSLPAAGATANASSAASTRPRGLGTLHRHARRRPPTPQQTGQSLMVPRYDIVPIPPELRAHMNPHRCRRSRPKPPRACSTSAPKTSSAASPRAPCCCCTARPTR